MCVAHALVPVAAFLFLRELSQNERLASLAAVVYSTSPHNGYFNALFVYGAMALPFFAFTLQAVARTARGGSAVFIAPPFVVVLATHHLTALVTLVSWLGLLVVFAVAGPRRALRRLALGLL